jgi:hypothetical protein
MYPMSKLVQVVKGPHDTFYGMREFTIRDYNRFWITFGQPVQAKAETGSGGPAISPRF